MASSGTVVDVRDRTTEFFQTVALFQKQRQSQLAAFAASASSSASSSRSQHYSDDENHPLISAPQPQPAKNFAQQSQFAQAAAHIGKGIYSVSEKLEKLTRLAKDRSLFGDSGPEVDELTFIINQDIKTLNTEIDVLEQFVQEGKRGLDSRHSAANSELVVRNLKTNLASTTKSFAEILQVRSQSIKEKNSRRREFDGSLSFQSHTRPAHRLDDGLDEVKNPAPTGYSGGFVEDEDEEDLAGGSLISQQEFQQAPQSQSDYYESRVGAVEEIEKVIVQLGQMYERLVNLVQEQEEVTIT